MADYYNRAEIKNVISALSTAASATIVRGGQAFDAPSGPYWVYNITSSSPRDFHKMWNLDVPGANAGIADREQILHVRYTLSFTGIDAPSSLQIDVQGRAMLFWFGDDLLGRQVCKDNGFIPRIIPASIGPRYVDQNKSDTEYRWGFDITLDSTIQNQITVERIQIVEATAQGEKLDGVRSDIIIASNK